MKSWSFLTNSHFCLFFPGASTTDRDSGPSLFFDLRHSPPSWVPKLLRLHCRRRARSGCWSARHRSFLFCQLWVVVEEVEKADFFSRMHRDLLNFEMPIGLVFLDSIAPSPMNPCDQNHNGSWRRFEATKCFSKNASMQLPFGHRSGDGRGFLHPLPRCSWEVWSIDLADCAPSHRGRSCSPSRTQHSASAYRACRPSQVVARPRSRCLGTVWCDEVPPSRVCLGIGSLQHPHPHPVWAAMPVLSARIILHLSAEFHLQCSGSQGTEVQLMRSSAAGPGNCVLNQRLLGLHKSSLANAQGSLEDWDFGLASVAQNALGLSVIESPRQCLLEWCPCSCAWCFEPWRSHVQVPLAEGSSLAFEVLLSACTWSFSWAGRASQLVRFQYAVQLLDLQLFPSGRAACWGVRIHFQLQDPWDSPVDPWWPCLALQRCRSSSGARLWAVDRHVGPRWCSMIWSEWPRPTPTCTKCSPSWKSPSGPPHWTHWHHQDASVVYWEAVHTFCRRHRTSQLPRQGGWSHWWASATTSHEVPAATVCIWHSSPPRTAWEAFEEPASSCSWAWSAEPLLLAPPRILRHPHTELPQICRPCSCWTLVVEVVPHSLNSCLDLLVGVVVEKVQWQVHSGHLLPACPRSTGSNGEHRIDVRPDLCTSWCSSSAEQDCLSLGLSCNLGCVVMVRGQHVVSAIGQQRPEHTMVHGIVLLWSNHFQAVSIAEPVAEHHGVHLSKCLPRQDKTNHLLQGHLLCR